MLDSVDLGVSLIPGRGFGLCSDKCRSNGDLLHPKILGCGRGPKGCRDVSLGWSEAEPQE